MLRVPSYYPSFIYFNLDHNEEKKEEQATDLIFSKFFSSPCPDSLKPFRLIKGVAFNYLKPIVKLAMQTLMQQEEIYQERECSNIDAALACSVIFLGNRQATQIMNYLRSCNNVALRISFPSGNQWTYTISSIFDGYLLAKINKNPVFEQLNEQEKKQQMQDYLKLSLQDFFNYLQPIIDQVIQQNEEKAIIQLKSIFKKISYDFNSPIIQSLWDDIQKNNQKINETTSFLYSIAGTIPENDQESLFEFFFLLEHYFCPTTHKSRFRIYEFNANVKTTLLHEIIKKQYGERGENALFLEDLDGFFQDLKIRCGKQDDSTHSSYLVFNNNILNGLSFRYFFTQFCPTDCVKHLADFLDSNSELKAAFSQKGTLEKQITYLSSELFANPSPLHESLKPFKLISDIATHELDLRIEQAAKILLGKYYSKQPRKLMTSCIHTACLVAIAFLGIQKSKMLFTKLTQQNAEIVPLVDFPSGHQWTCKVVNLFSGDVVYRMNQDHEFEFLNKKERKQKIDSYLRPSIADFKNYVQPIIQQALQEPCEDLCIEKLNQAFRQMDYEFNKQLLENLRTEITQNQAKITNQTSFIYGIALLESNKLKSKHQIEYRHIFILEQFLHPTLKEVCFRRYQSQIGDATLLEDMHKLAKTHKGFWYNATLNQFLDQLTTLCCDRQVNFSDQYAICFGYESANGSLLRFNKNTLSGLSVRYVSSPLHPGECYKNIAEMIQLYET